MARWSDFIEEFQLVNEFKGFPAMVGIDIDLDAANQWWDKEGTPSTAVTMVDVAGEGITETYEYALKTITDAANEGLSQTWTYVDEPRVKSGRVLSVICAIWSVSGLSVTAKLVNSDTSEKAANAVTAAAWTVVKIEGHTLAGTSCKFQVTANGAGTFYIVPLGACIGPAVMPLGPRGWRYTYLDMPVPVKTLTGLGDEATWTDIDVTANSSSLAVMAELRCYVEEASDTFVLALRRNGSAVAYNNALIRAIVAPDTEKINNMALMLLDDAQIFEYYLARAAGTTLDKGYIYLHGWWEWS